MLVLDDVKGDRNTSLTARVPLFVLAQFDFKLGYKKKLTSVLLTVNNKPTILLMSLKSLIPCHKKQPQPLHTWMVYH